MNKNLREILSWQEYGPPMISELNLKQATKGEWHGPCPNFGGTDRFWINEFEGNVKTHCRQCHDFAAINDTLRNQGLLPKWKPDVTPSKASPSASSIVVPHLIYFPSL